MAEARDGFALADGLDALRYVSTAALASLGLGPGWCSKPVSRSHCLMEKASLRQLPSILPPKGPMAKRPVIQVRLHGYLCCKPLRLGPSQKRLEEASPRQFPASLLLASPMSKGPGIQGGMLAKLCT